MPSYSEIFTFKLVGDEFSKMASFSPITQDSQILIFILSPDLLFSSIEFDKYTVYSIFQSWSQKGSPYSRERGRTQIHLNYYKCFHTSSWVRSLTLEMSMFIMLFYTYLS